MKFAYKVKVSNEGGTAISNATVKAEMTWKLFVIISDLVITVVPFHFQILQQNSK